MLALFLYGKYLYMYDSTFIRVAAYQNDVPSTSQRYICKCSLFAINLSSGPDVFGGHCSNLLYCYYKAGCGRGKYNLLMFLKLCLIQA